MTLPKGLDLRSDPRGILLMWAVTVVLLGVAGWRYASAGALMSMTSTEAQVLRAAKVGTRCSSRSTGSRSCSPLYRYQVSFSTRDGRRVAAWTPKGTVSRHRPGETITVRYRPAAPRAVTLDAPLYHWLVVILFGGLGLLGIAGSGRATTRYLRRQRR